MTRQLLLRRLLLRQLLLRRLLLPLGFLFAVTAGCTASHGPGTIDFQVTGGFAGNGDGTPRLRIEPDGTMTRGTQTTTLDRATLDDLEAKVDAAQFATLSPMYTACADCYVYVVSVQIDGTTYTVAADTLATVPAPLEAVIATLKDISQRPVALH
jgi:hypothetical protein